MCNFRSIRLILMIAMLLMLLTIAAACAAPTLAPTEATKPTAAPATAAPAPTEPPVPTTAPEPTEAPAATHTPEKAAAASPKVTVSVSLDQTEVSFPCQIAIPAPTPTWVFQTAGDQCFVKDQILVIGPKDLVDSAQKGLPLEQLRRFIPDSLDLKPNSKSPEFPWPEDANVVFDLYRVTDNSAVEDVVVKFNQSARGSEKDTGKGLAFADLNYLVGDPSYVEGSPYISFPAPSATRPQALGRRNLPSSGRSPTS